MEMSKLNALNICNQYLEKTWCARDSSKNGDELMRKWTPKELKENPWTVNLASADEEQGRRQMLEDGKKKKKTKGKQVKWLHILRSNWKLLKEKMQCFVK